MNMELEHDSTEAFQKNIPTNLTEVGLDGSPVHTKDKEAESLNFPQQSEANIAESVLHRSKQSQPVDKMKRNDEKSEILDFMRNLKKYFEKRNLLDDYDYIVESIANLSSTELYDMDDLLFEVVTLLKDSKELLLQFAKQLPARLKLSVIEYATKVSPKEAKYPASIAFKHHNRYNMYTSVTVSYKTTLKGKSSNPKWLLGGKEAN